MKKIAALGMLVTTLLTAAAGGEDLPPLPVWSPSDFTKLKEGKIISGQDFFGPAVASPDGIGPEGLEEGLPVPLPGETAPEELSTEISRAHLIRYFRSIPTDIEGSPVYLIDPQEFLAQQDFRDRESFLEYHASESKIDLYVYLFDARQELPDDITIQSVYQDLYQGRGPTALVFYHLGMPERSLLILSSDIRAVVSEDEQNRALRAAVQEAFEKSDAAYQLDNFLVELSIRLYWIEREMAGLSAQISTGSINTVAAAVGGAAGTASGSKGRNLIQAAVVWVSCLGVIGLLGWLMHWLVDRRIRYHFPEVEIGPLLGAPHAAGVGAVVSFSSAQIPPSQQRDQVPDYLHRL